MGPDDHLRGLVSELRRLGPVVPDDRGRGWWVRLARTGDGVDDVLVRAVPDDWVAYVAVIWGDETDAVDEVVRVLRHRDPATVQLLVSYDYALVESPYVS